MLILKYTLTSEPRFWRPLRPDSFHHVVKMNSKSAGLFVPVRFAAPTGTLAQFNKKSESWFNFVTPMLASEPNLPNQSLRFGFEVQLFSIKVEVLPAEYRLTLEPHFLFLGESWKAYAENARLVLVVEYGCKSFG